MMVGVGARRAYSTISVSRWSAFGVMGPAANRFFLTSGSGIPPNDAGVRESTAMGPIGDGIIPQST